MNLSRYFTAFLLALMLIFASVFSHSAAAVEVTPLGLDLEVEPGATQEFEFNLIGADEERTVELNPYRPVQDATGAVEYREVGPEDYEPVGWLDMPGEVDVFPEETTTVEGELEAPVGAAGSYPMVIMAEPVVEEEGDEFVVFQVRYAVTLDIDVTGYAERPGLEIAEFELEEDEEGLPEFTTRVQNTTSLLFPTAAEVSIRDENRRLVERTQLSTEQAGAETDIYPHGELIFSESPEEALLPGEYSLRLFVRFADGRQQVESREITVEEGQFAYPPERLDQLQVEPASLMDEISAGSAMTEPVQIENRGDETLLVSIEGQEIVEDYPYSIFANTEVEIRGDQNFQLEAGRQQRAVFSFRADRDLEPGGYYGRLEIMAETEEGEIVESQTVDLKLLVGEDWQAEADISSLETQSVEDRELFSLDMHNSGRVHLEPQAVIRLRDENGDLIETIEPELEEEVVFPDRFGRFVAELEGLDAGSYYAEVELNTAAGEELDSEEFALEIE